jgi:hypothetical protein
MQRRLGPHAVAFVTARICMLLDFACGCFSSPVVFVASYDKFRLNCVSGVGLLGELTAHHDQQQKCDISGTSSVLPLFSLRILQHSCHFVGLPGANNNRRGLCTDGYSLHRERLDRRGRNE